MIYTKSVNFGETASCLVYGSTGAADGRIAVTVHSQYSARDFYAYFA